MFPESTFTVRLTCRKIAEAALIERYLAGRLGDDLVEALEAHYLTCARCQTEVELGAAIRDGLAALTGGSGAPSPEAPADPDPPRQVGPGRNRLRAAAIATVALAAGVAGILTARSSPPSPEAFQHRDEALDVTWTPEIRAPVGDVTTVSAFRWSPVTSADLYRVRIYSDEGTVIWEAETQAAHLAWPSELRLASNTRYLWEVEARVGFDRWVNSDLVRFRVTRQ